MVALRLNAAGSAAVWSTYIGGVTEDFATTVALAADGSVWVGGFTWAADFPTTEGAYRRTFTSALSMGFLTLLRLDRGLLYQLVLTTEVLR